MPTFNEYKANRANYKQLRGIVGQYRGSDVYVIPEKDFNLKESSKDSRLIYALIVPNRKDLLLVSSGMAIGDMTPSGYVTMWEKSEFYYGPEKEIEEPITAVNTTFNYSGGNGARPKVEVEFDVSTSGISVDDFLAGETLVDRFLRGMQF